MESLEVIPQQIGRVFLNMVSNACYATNEKRAAQESTQNSERYGPALWLSTRRGEDRAEISIRDNGIPPDVIEKIFNPFFTTKPTDKGTGLGLAMCNDIVREHGGTIRSESQLGQFTEMVVELPLTPPPIAPEGDAADFDQEGITDSQGQHRDEEESSGGTNVT